MCGRALVLQRVSHQIRPRGRLRIWEGENMGHVHACEVFTEDATRLQTSAHASWNGPLGVRQAGVCGIPRRSLLAPMVS